MLGRPLRWHAAILGKMQTRRARLRRNRGEIPERLRRFLLEGLAGLENWARENRLRAESASRTVLRQATDHRAGRGKPSRACRRIARDALRRPTDRSPKLGQSTRDNLPVRRARRELG